MSDQDEENAPRARSDGVDAGDSIDVVAEEQLFRAIEEDIVPALMKFHAGPGAFSVPSEAADLLDPGAVQAFVNTILQQDYAQTVAYLEELRRRPTELSILFSDVMTPAAQRLGEMWLEDECSFVDVTLGVAHLQRLVRDFAPLYTVSDVDAGEHGSALFVTTSGEQHTFALALLGESFRRAGWTVYEAPQHTVGELCELLEQEHFDLIGFSMSYTALADALESDIEAVRRNSSFGSTRIVVGGPAFIEEPELAVGLKADAIITDVKAALKYAASLPVLKGSQS